MKLCVTRVYRNKDTRPRCTQLTHVLMHITMQLMQVEKVRTRLTFTLHLQQTINNYTTVSLRKKTLVFRHAILSGGIIIIYRAWKRGYFILVHSLVTVIIFLSLPRPLNTENVLTKVRHNNYNNTCFNTVELL